MNVDTLIRQVTRNIKAQNGEIIELFNRCSDDLTSLVKKEATKSYPIDPTNQYTFPSDYYQTAFVTVDRMEYFLLPQRDFTRRGYKVWGNQFSLQNGPEVGEIDLFYHRTLNRLRLPDDIPEIEEPFHDLYVHFAIGQLQFKDEDYEYRPDALTRYYARKDEYQAYLSEKYQGAFEIQAVDR